MNVITYSQNNLPKQSFGMKIGLNPNDVNLNIELNVIPRMMTALEEVNVAVSDLKPDNVTLSHTGTKPDEFMPLVRHDVWRMIDDARGNFVEVVTARYANSWFADLVAKAKELSNKHP